MNFKEYFKNEFPKDLRTLNFQKPNSAIQSNPELFRIDNDTIYFGGRDWNNINEDIFNIQKNNQEYFFLCLFTITTIDLTMFTYYKDSYESFRGLTMYPKFGWSGFGPHYENPKKLILIPEKKGLIDKGNFIKYLDEYLDLFISECNSFFESKMPGITTKDFIGRIINDREFLLKDSDCDSVFEILYNKLKEKIS